MRVWKMNGNDARRSEVFPPSRGIYRQRVCSVWVAEENGKDDAKHNGSDAVDEIRDHGRWSFVCKR